jgi:quercetin dioxygenase-like cupin family protein
MTATFTANTFEEFEAKARNAGFDEALARDWEPNSLVETHSHPFEAHATVTQGEMWLIREGGETQHLLAGDGFVLARGTPHSERYGPEGATYWVARRN